MQTNTHIEVPAQNYPGELHAPCVDTSLQLSLAVTVFQRVNFKHKPRLFPLF